ncbi:MAG: 16S rRNA (guanine(527)-N(7))-methyltransferase RsmG [Tenacibaculum sp.]
MDIINKYFAHITEEQQRRYAKLQSLYKDWNLKINLVSRKDINELYLRHILHSLVIAKVLEFKPKAKVIDVGTGGGFPGIPLAILFPQTQFHLVDSIGKKVKVVDEIVDVLGLLNVKTSYSRIEQLEDSCDFVVGRAVAQMETFYRWVKNKIHKKQNHSLKNGILYLKGGNLTQELSNFNNAFVYELSDYYSEPFFDTKKLVYLPV